MKLNGKIRRAMSALAACVMAAGLSVPAYADNSLPYARPDVGRETSVELRYHQGNVDFDGVDFRVYKVADMDDSVNFTLAGEFEDYPISLNGEMTAADWVSAAGVLAGYVDRDKVQPDYAGKTDEKGVYAINKLDAGLWLVSGGSHQRTYRTTENGESVLHRVYYHAAPFLVATPSLENGQWLYDVGISPKFTASEDEYISRRVLKVWDDAGYESQRPGALTFDLVRDGEIYDTVELNAGNAWRAQWDDLDNSYRWRIVEHAAGNYSVSARQEGMTYVVTNSYNEPAPPFRPRPTPDPIRPTPPTDIPDPNVPLDPGPQTPADPSGPAEPQDPDVDIPDPGVPTDPGKPGPGPGIDIPDPEVPLTGLPQTGQLWWPVPVLAFAGLVLFLGGWASGRRKDGAER